MLCYIPLILIVCIVVVSARKVPYQMTMELGRAYDLGTDQIGVDIFGSISRNETKEEIFNYYSANAALVMGTKSVSEVSGITGSLLLKTMSRNVNIPTFTEYVKSNIAHNAVEILVYAAYYTSKKSIIKTQKPILVCNDGKFISSGTHYTRTIAYGGDLLTSVKLTPRGGKTLTNLQNEIYLLLGGTKDVDTVIKKLEFLEKNSSKTVKLRLDVYGSQPLVYNPHNMKELRGTISVFSQVVSASTYNKLPLYVELFPISGLPGCSHTQVWKANRVLNTKLYQFADRFRDVQVSRKIFKAWLTTFARGKSRTDVHWKKVTDYQRKIDRLTPTFEATVSELDVSATGDTDQLDKATLEYEQTGKSENTTLYQSELSYLITNIVKGGWCPWSDFSKCTATCGLAYRGRRRVCKCPPPLDGANCAGMANNVQLCDDIRCPKPTCKWSVNTKPGKPFLHECPNNGVITGIATMFNTSRNDRSWAFKCCDLKDGKSHIVNASCARGAQVAHILDAHCPRGHYVSTLSSSYSRFMGDRAWAISCVATDRIVVLTHRCKRFKLNDWMKDKTIDSDWVVTGMESRRYLIVDNYYNDFLWHVIMCPYRVEKSIN